MNKVLVTTIGVVLVAGAVSAWAGQAEKQQLKECNAEIVEHFGKGTRTRLSRVTRGDDGVSMRILVRAAEGGNEPVICTAVDGDNYLLTNEDGVALTPVGEAAGEQVTLAE